MKSIFDTLSRYMKGIAVYIAMSFLSTVLCLMQPYVVSSFIDHLINRVSQNILNGQIAMIAAIGILILLLEWLINIKEKSILNKIIFDYIQKIYEHYLRLPFKQVSNYDPVMMTQRIKSDTAQIIGFIMKDTLGVVFQLITLGISTFFLLSISSIFIKFFVIFFSGYIGLYYAYRSILFKKGYNARMANDDFVKTLTYQISDVKNIKVRSAIENSTVRLNLKFDKLYQTTMAYTKESGLYGLLNGFITLVFNIIVFIFVSKRVFMGEITIGQLTMIHTYFSYMIGAVNTLMCYSKNVQDFKVSMERIEEIQAHQIEQTGSMQLEEIENMSVKQLEFSFDYQKPLLEDVTINFKRGDVYIVKGINGCGKSTLFDILLGLYNDCIPYGRVRFNDNDFKDIDFHDIRKHQLSYVGKINYYGTETVREFLLDDSEYLANDEKKLMEEDNESLIVTIEVILDKLKIKSFFMNERFHVIDHLDKKMSNLSGGQRQKIGILNELLKNPNAIFFDEPTSYLDIESMLEFKHLVKMLQMNRIVVIATHENIFDDIAENIIDLANQKTVHSLSVQGA